MAEKSPADQLSPTFHEAAERKELARLKAKYEDGALAEETGQEQEGEDDDHGDWYGHACKQAAQARADADRMSGPPAAEGARPDEQGLNLDLHIHGDYVDETVTARCSEHGMTRHPRCRVCQECARIQSAPTPSARLDEILRIGQRCREEQCSCDEIDFTDWPSDVPAKCGYCRSIDRIRRALDTAREEEKHD